MLAKKRNNNSAKLVAIILIVSLLASYVIYQAVVASKSEMETQFALYETVYKTINTSAFAIRDEAFVTNSATGTRVSFAANGARVARGDTVSVVFDSADDAASYLRISELEESIEHYTELSGQANFQTMNIESLTTKIDNELVDFLEARDSRDYKKAIDSARVFRDSVTGKQIATGSELDFSKQLATMQNELATLKQTQYKYTEIKSETAGYYIHGSDGYENVLKHSDIDKITVDDVEKALEAKPGEVNSDVVGRVVNSFKWYLVCAVDTDETVNLSYGNKLYINIPYQGVERLPVTLYKIGERTGDKTMLILSCDLMNDSISDIRIENIEIITEEYRGYKILNSSIRTVDGEKGVYVVRGNLLGFRKIRVLYTTDSYSIVDNPDGASDYIKLYDKVVTKGVELYDNKLL